MVERRHLDSGSDQAAEQLSDMGETSRFGINDPVGVLYGEGYRHVESTTFDEACLRYTGEYDRAWMFRFQTLVVAGRRPETEFR